jgi:hypothetical protein
MAGRCRRLLYGHRRRIGGRRVGNVIAIAFALVVVVPIVITPRIVHQGSWSPRRVIAARKLWLQSMCHDRHRIRRNIDCEISNLRVTDTVDTRQR